MNTSTHDLTLTGRSTGFTCDMAIIPTTILDTMLQAKNSTAAGTRKCKQQRSRTNYFRK